MNATLDDTGKKKRARARSSALFAAAVFLSAFLLFQIQPLVSKAILPWFGGTPGVWTACMLFFQVVLFGGYAYAHLLTSRVPVRGQALLHLVLIGLALVFLKVVPDESWKPDGEGRPALRIVLLLTATVGLPYFLLATTGPLLQRWFSLVHSKRSPYRLYALSNAGSLIALLSYPFLVEPVLAMPSQARLWAIGFWGFTVLCAGCAFRLWGVTSAAIPAALSSRSGSSAESPTAGRYVLWFVLAMLASTMYLATTNEVCQDVAVVPFLWVAPLSLYLLSFILCFESDKWYLRCWWAPATGGLVLGVCWVMVFGTDVALLVQVAVYFGALFAVCMTCHGELARLRPDPRHLTAFYLTLAAGGAGGGVFVALVAPSLFPDFWEFQLCLLASLLCAIVVFFDEMNWLGGDDASTSAAADRMEQSARPIKSGRGGRGGRVRSKADGRDVRQRMIARPGLPVGQTRPPGRPPLIARAVAVVLVTVVGTVFVESISNYRRSVAMTRNFYGVLEVEVDEPSDAVLLRHGRIIHGVQLRDPGRQMTPTTYYSRRTGVGRAIELLQSRKEALRIGLVGLGVGTLAAYGRDGDVLRFYEINADVDRHARTHFSFLKDSPAQVETVLGDARLSLAAEAPQEYDLLVLDAFSGDAVPTHLLTREAFAEYLRHIADGGIIAVHISNLHFDLQLVTDALAEEFGLPAVTIIVPEIAMPVDPSSSWVLMARDPRVLDAESFRTGVARPQPNRVLWTDNFSNLFQVLRR